MKTIFISFLIFANISIAQKTKIIETIKISPETDLKAIQSSQEKSTENTLRKEFYYRLDNLEFNSGRIKNDKNHSFDFLGNFGNNVSFGGFYESFAVINFTPQIYIKPAGFISVYANHYLNVLIPLSRAKEVSNSVLISSVSMLALEYASDLLFRNESWLAEIAEFTIKNCLLNLSLKPGLKNKDSSNENILQFDNFYYSISISF
ncbi:MAG TPA: hypothetical protein PKA90_07985 [Ignavibacteria bacterium]|nr:hypothetical protein [Ignavibacteria bacterium]HMR40358.1 hypothetical protein [Ignavibacteria bacterium]